MFPDVGSADILAATPSLVDFLSGADMRLNRALRRSPWIQRLLLWSCVLSLVGAACGGGAPASSPTTSPSPAATVPGSPQRAALASPVASPSPVATAAAKPTASVAPGETYTVQEGDTLLLISEKFYGDGTKWRRIFDANRDVISDPDALKIDMKLKIPPKE